ncbi:MULTISPECIES: hemopexin repeat-containing protein [unclassified Streptomyces]|uniref:hemopexin repeat-containing protein n=1 Tax=unclassified Streptomyces TaxID=2593676 RepID=UPI001F520A21|nr:hemopexin repeat-containing protein [Streptomyces sp. CB02058]
MTPRSTTPPTRRSSGCSRTTSTSATTSPPTSSWAAPSRSGATGGGLPDSFTRRIDAAAPHVTDRTKVYLFKDDQYVRYDLAADRTDAGYPKPIRGNWPFFS